MHYPGRWVGIFPTLIGLDFDGLTRPQLIQNESKPKLEGEAQFCEKNIPEEHSEVRIIRFCLFLVFLIIQTLVNFFSTIMSG